MPDNYDHDEGQFIETETKQALGLVIISRDDNSVYLFICPNCGQHNRLSHLATPTCGWCEFDSSNCVKTF